MRPENHTAPLYRVIIDNLLHRDKSLEGLKNKVNFFKLKNTHAPCLVV